MNNSGLSSDTLNIINLVFNKYKQIDMVYIFGSRAKGNFKQNSDVDLAILGEIDSLFAEQIAYELEELPLPYKFDVQAYKNIKNVSLKEHIDRVGIVIYTKTQNLKI
jgi:predicted nucleotidyltransferase